MLNYFIFSVLSVNCLVICSIVSRVVCALLNATKLT